MFIHNLYCMDTYLLMYYSLSSGEDHLEKLTEMERILHQAQGEKMRMFEQQVSLYFTFYYFSLFFSEIV